MHWVPCGATTTGWYTVAISCPVVTVLVVVVLVAGHVPVVVVVVVGETTGAVADVMEVLGRNTAPAVPDEEPRGAALPDAEAAPWAMSVAI